MPPPLGHAKILNTRVENQQNYQLFFDILTKPFSSIQVHKKKGIKLYYTYNIIKLINYERFYEIQ